MVGPEIFNAGKKEKTGIKEEETGTEEALMARKMNQKMQLYNLSRMIASGSRHPTDTIDTRALMDSTLSLSENRKNISKQIGMTTRNYGMEQYNQREDDRKRTKIIRQDKTRQVGISWFPDIDKARTALPPGKRISKTGRRYYERRVNRSDAPPGRV
jgi:hypothetical protein